MTSIMITGVAGFIGSNLAISLLSKGFRVVGVDNMSQGSESNLVPFLNHSKFEFLKCDVRDASTIDRVVAKVDAIYHFAAFKIPRYENALSTLQVNYQGSHTVLNAATKHKKRLVFTSTSDCYGRNPNVPFSESSDFWMGPPTVKRWAYAVSKAYDEMMLQSAFQNDAVPITIVRLFGGYGPHQNLTWWGGPQSVFIGAALRGDTIEIHGDGMQTRSFTYVDDHIEGFVRCLDQKDSIGEVINFGGTEEICIRDLADLIWSLAGQGEAKLHYLPYSTFGKYEDVMRRVPDHSKCERILGFTPRVSLREGLMKTIEWQRTANS